MTHDARRNRVLCGGEDGSIYVYSLDLDSILVRFELPGGCAIWVLAYDKNTDRVFVGRQYEEKTITSLCIVDLDRMIFNPVGFKHTVTVCCAVYCMDRGSFYFGGNGGNVNCVDLRNPSFMASTDELAWVHFPWGCCDYPESCNNAEWISQLYDIWCLGSVVVDDL
jgi:hypothetical protein